MPYGAVAILMVVLALPGTDGSVEAIEVLARFSKLKWMNGVRTCKRIFGKGPVSLGGLDYCSMSFSKH